MKITNEEIAAQFYELADLLEIEGANPFRVRAYRNAASAITALGKNIVELMALDYDLTQIPGIGQDLAGKIQEIVLTGKLGLLKQTAEKTPPILSQLMKIEGLGPKRVKLVYDKFKINSVDDLKKAIANGSILELKGFGPVLVEKILQGIVHAAKYSKSTRLKDIFIIAQLFLAHLKSLNFIKQVEMAGSFRRRKEVVHDLDIVASATSAAGAIKHFLSFTHIKEVLAHGKTKASVRLKSGLQVDFRVVKDSVFGAALLYFTGSKAHNVAIRKLCLEKKLKLNEYGLFRGQQRIAGQTEDEIYKKIGLKYIEPELREARGEIEASLSNKLPRLIAEKDIRGDLHVHTKETDGVEDLKTMVEAAIELGYEYVAITDHSKHLAITKGLDEKRLLKQIDKIDALNARLKGFTVLKSIEVDILEDGKLDLSDNVLKKLDLTVCSVHSNFHLSSKKQTDRIIRAMDNKYFNILGHPTGRLINRRPAYDINIEKVIKAASQRGCFLEVNAQPSRLDLNDIYCRLAKDMGVKLVISTDAHNIMELYNMKFGIFQARRGWLEKSDIVNTRKLLELRALLKR